VHQLRAHLLAQMSAHEHLSTVYNNGSFSSVTDGDNRVLVRERIVHLFLDDPLAADFRA
jgi:hypothetical protein